MNHQRLRATLIGVFMRAVDDYHSFGTRDGDQWMVQWVEAMDADEYVKACEIAANSPGPLLLSMAAYGGAVMCYREQTNGNVQSSTG